MNSFVSRTRVLARFAARQHTITRASIATTTRLPFRASFGTTAHSSEATGDIPVRHRSNAEELISKVKPIEVDADSVMCDGGGGALGHPIEFIKLNENSPTVCKYCGLTYIAKPHH